MPLLTGLLLGGASLIGGKMAADAANKAASQQSDAAREAMKEQQRQFDLQWEAAAPSRNALARLARIQSGEEEFDVTALPGYEDRFQEGLRAVMARQAGGGGGRFGGRAAKELTRYGQSQAAKERGNYLNRLAQVAGLRGDPASPGVGPIMEAGRAQAAGTLGAGQAWGQALGSGMQNWLAFQQQQRMMQLMNPQIPAGGAGFGIGMGGGYGLAAGM